MSTRRQTPIRSMVLVLGWALLAAKSHALKCGAGLPRTYGVTKKVGEPKWCTRSFELGPGQSKVVELDLHWPTVLHATVRLLEPGGQNWWKRKRINRGRIDPPAPAPLRLSLYGPGSNLLDRVDGTGPLRMRYRVGREGLDCGYRFKFLLENPGHLGHAMGTLRVTYREATHHGFLRDKPTS